MMRIETPAARATDPETSRQAETEHTASGARAAQQQLAAQAVRSYPGLTSLELSKRTSMDRYVLARRLPECETGRAVRKGQARRCAVSGKTAVTWWPVGTEEQTQLFPRDPA